jgi:lipid-A-disaccharide synthase
MRVYVIAGEASGDLHGANLIKAFNQQESGITWRGWGGDRMKAEGLMLHKHIQDLAFMGFAEVIMNLKTILRNLKSCKDDIREFKPDAVIMIDYPGFNLRIAPFVRKLGIPVLYYVSPQIWAWNSNRVHGIKKHVNQVYCILPFEKDFYARYGMEVEYVGHPLLDELQLKQFSDDHNPSMIIAVLPGSRKQEISKILPVMLAMVKKFPEHTFKIAGAPSIDQEFYTDFMQSHKVNIEYGNTYGILQEADAALVTSGTATLETALIGVPEVVCYSGNPISYMIARRVVKIKYISLVNLIMDREVVKELIQGELNSINLEKELRLIIEPGKHRKKMRDDFMKLREKLGGKGASERTAIAMLKRIKESRLEKQQAF